MTITILSSAPDQSTLAVRHQTDTELKISPPLKSNDAMVGKIIVSESKLYFYSEESCTGISVDYRDVIIHAIARYEEHTSIYCQLDQGLFLPDQAIPEDDSEVMTELHFIIKDENELGIIYAALCDCAALHPDEDQDGDDSNDDAFIDANNDELTEEQQAKLNHLDSLLTNGSATGEEPDDGEMRKRQKHASEDTS